MDTIAIKIDAELAGEYILQYREFAPDGGTDAHDDESLLQGFMRDRLREETEFLARENE